MSHSETRTERFTFLCSTEEKTNLRKLSNYYLRTRSEIIRMLIRKAAGEIDRSQKVTSGVNTELSHETSSAPRNESEPV